MTTITINTGGDSDVLGFLFATISNASTQYIFQFDQQQWTAGSDLAYDRVISSTHSHADPMGIPTVDDVYAVRLVEFQSFGPGTVFDADFAGMSIPFRQFYTALHTSQSAFLNLLGNVTFNGNAGADRITLGSGNDTLDGGAGADYMAGGTGNDTYWVDNADDRVIELNGQGTDTVNASVSFNISGYEIENLNLRTGASINGTGNSAANIINGNSGNNIIDGLGGADTMSGAQGNDTYWVDNAGDKVIELNGQGTDTVNSTVSFNLSGQEIENLNLRTGASINGTGNSAANIIVGNSGANVISGLGGDDRLSGAEGNDTINGGDGNDRIDGGTGTDQLTGGAGNDTFLFLVASGGTDIIVDFSNASGNNDVIHLENAVYTHLAAGALNAANLRIGGAALDANDYLIYNPATGNLAYDADGNGAGGTVIIANIANHATLTAADFFVV